MAEGQSRLNKHDRVQSIMLADLPDGGKLVGYRGDEQVLLLCGGTEMFRQPLTNGMKSARAANLLRSSRGGIGGHRFYLGHTGSGVAMLILLVLGFVTLPVGVSLILLVVVGVRVVFNTILAASMIQKRKDAVNKNVSTGTVDR